MAQGIIDRPYVGEVLQHIYTRELNIQLTVFFNWATKNNGYPTGTTSCLDNSSKYKTISQTVAASFQPYSDAYFC